MRLPSLPFILVTPQKIFPWYLHLRKKFRTNDVLGPFVSSELFSNPFMSSEK